MALVPFKVCMHPKCCNSSSSIWLTQRPKWFLPFAHGLPLGIQPRNRNTDAFGGRKKAERNMQGFACLCGTHPNSTCVSSVAIVSGISNARRSYRSVAFPQWFHPKLALESLPLPSVAQRRDVGAHSAKNLTIEVDNGPFDDRSPTLYSMHVLQGSSKEHNAKKMDQTSPHIPVLFTQVVEAFAGCHLKNFIDCTVGAGGHAVSIISSHPEIENFVAMDVDPVAHEESAKKIKSALQSIHSQKGIGESKSPPKFYPILENFKNMAEVLPRVHLREGEINGILLDIGVSSMQIDVAERGFSFMKPGKLDMRMNPNLSLTAEDIVNDWSEAEIGRILREYGEERRWKFLAQKIVQERARGRITTTDQLTQIIGGYKGYKKAGIHPSTRTFQALRIAVNDELNVLESIIPTSIRALAPGGRLAIISFHSLEDRIVKHAFLKYEKMERDQPEGILHENDETIEHETEEIERHQSFSKYKKKLKLKSENSDAELTSTDGPRDELMNLETKHEGWIKTKSKRHDHNGIIQILTKKPITANDEELKFNPRSRSAKLRVIQKL